MKFKELYDSEYLHKKNSWADIIFTHPFTVVLSKFFAKYQVSPNLITVSTIPICFLAALMFAMNHLIPGALIFWLAYILDGVDGEVARRLNRCTPFGSKLDARVDILNHLMMYAGLIYSQYYLSGDLITGGFILLVHYLIIFLGIVLIQDVSYKTFSPHIHSYYSTFEEGWGTFFLAPILNCFVFLFPILVGLQVLTHIILIIKRRKNIKELRQRIKRSILRTVE